jgi:hypothetical protein
VIDGNGSFPTLGFGVVDGGGSLSTQHSLALVQLGHLVIEGYLLIMELSCSPLGVDLSGAGSCLLLLLVGLLLLGEELHS